MQTSVTQEKKSLPPSLLISAAYDSQKRCAVLKFYDPKSQKITLWSDKTNHKPYCYSKLNPEELGHISDRDDILDIKPQKIHDMLQDKQITVSKITAADPLAIGGTQTEKSIRNSIEAWEADIKYYETYLYDCKLIVGKYYEIIDDKIHPHHMDISKEVKESLQSLLWDKVSHEKMVDTNQYQEFIAEWADLLNQPIPKMKRLSFDIEVESEIGRIPDPKIAEKKVTAIGFDGTDYKRIFVLKKSEMKMGENELPSDVDVVFYEQDQEKQMIQDAFKIISDFPFILTYNGDEFDMPYLYNRAERLGIPNAENPLYMMRDSATLKHGVHIDLYRTLSNRSFQIYAFSAKYTDFSLNSVSKALLGEEKIDYGIKLDELDLYQMANYCYNDARLTHKLTTFGNNILMDLLVVITRIAKMPIDDIARMGVSQWIRSLLYYEHRRRDALIPKRDELEKKSMGVSNDAIIKDKKYRGGLVVEPEEGIHFDVTVMDFASLYPSIIKIKNISYETVRCPHKECKENAIPDTNHWACTKQNGLTALLIGSLRDLRVNYYKSLSKNESFSEEQRQQYTVVSQALKVILNASYGVMGAEIFPLYFLPAAEATTAIGRHIILQTIQKCKENGIQVLYGDTDSLFIKKPTREQIQNIIDQAKADHGVELEEEKEYRYVVLSNRKKNYLGVTKSGKVDVKGLTGKKSHTPPFIKTLFYELLDVLSKVQNIEDFERTKNQISQKISECAKKVEAGQIPMEELAFNVMISKAPSEYTKTIPQHIKAAKQLESKDNDNGKSSITSYMQIPQHVKVAKQLESTGKEVKKGSIISYVKVKGKIGVKPTEMTSKDDVDTTKYMEFMESTLDQITSSMGLDFDQILRKQKQTGLDEYFDFV